MASTTENPYKKFKKALKGAKLSGEKVHEMMMKKMKSSIKYTGKFEGKSNKLGHGGRAAQLKARGVPGGVIGMLARKAQAAPGEKNFHGKKAKRSKKSSINKGEEGDVEMKKSKKRKSTLNRGEEGDVERKASKRKQAPFMKQEKKLRKSSKRRKHSEEAIKGLEEFAHEEKKEKKGSKKEKGSKKAKGAC